MSSEFVRKLHQKYPLMHLVPYLKLYRRRIVIGVLMVLLTNGVAVIAPWVLGRAVGALSQSPDDKTLLFYGGLIVGLSAVEGVFRYLMRRILIGVSRYLEYDLRNEVFKHLQLLNPRFYQKNPTGDIMSRATNDLSAVRMVLGPGFAMGMHQVA